MANDNKAESSGQDDCFQSYGSLLARNQEKLLNISHKVSSFGLRKININKESKYNTDDFSKNVIQYSKHPTLDFFNRICSCFTQLFSNVAVFLVFLCLDILHNVSIIEYFPKKSFFELLPNSVWLITLHCIIYFSCEAYRCYTQFNVTCKQNTRKCEVFSVSTKRFRRTQWTSLRAGQILRLGNKEMVPADVILLASSHSDGLVFIDTHLIDGGTHFKKKYAVKETQGDTKFSICSSIRGRLMYEAPGSRSEDFKATLSLDGHPRVASLDYRCFVAQGSVICGCDWVLAVVVYTGHETRVSLQNAPFLPFYARSNSLEDYNLYKAPIHVIIVCFFVWLVFLYLGFFYTPYKTNFTAVGDLKRRLISIILEHLKILVCICPLFLSVLRYIASFLQTFTTHHNKPDKHNVINVYNSNTSSLLGKADFLITDKTGTLTNGQRMSFACLFIDGRVYGELALTKNGKKNHVKRSTCSFEEEPSKFVQNKTKVFKKKNLLSHLNSFISNYFPIQYYKRKSKIWKFIYSLCKKGKKPQTEINYFENTLLDKKVNQAAHKHQIFHFRSPAMSVRMLYPKFSSKPLINKRCFSCPSIIISHTTTLNKSKKSIKSFQSFPSYLASRTEFSDTRILDDLCKKNVRSTSIKNMLLGMSLCNSVATTSDALMYLLKSSANREHHSVQQGDSLCNFSLSQSHSRIALPLDESIWTSSRHPQLTDEILWSSNILWKEEAVSFLRYQAEYPEEECLLAGCTSIGFRLLWRSSSLIILERRGKILRYEVLGYNAFDSSRQRMSIVVRLENTTNVYLFCKGSDNAVLQLCSPLSQYDNHKKMERIRRYIRCFSQNGLRTLVFACRSLSLEEQDCFQRLQSFVAAHQNRKDDIYQILDSFESNLTFLGISGVRERVSRGVVNTIRNLGLAGVRVWMMTGDHSELGLHIAYTSKIFQPTSIVFHVHISPNSSKCSILLRKEIRSLYSRFCSLLQTRHIDEPVALLISGPEIEIFLSSGDLKVVFCSLICCSDAVVFCRMTPELKRRVIQLLKNKLTPSPIVFALGDGSNDIPMFREADGGIVVMDTKQKCYAPCLNSLYIQIPSIKHVKRLFFVHGRLFSMRVWFATMLVYYSVGLSLGEVVTLSFFTGNTHGFLYTFERLLFCQFFFCVCIISINSLKFKDIPDPIAENLPWAYLLVSFLFLLLWFLLLRKLNQSRRESRNKCRYIIVEILKGFLTLIISSSFITIPYFSYLTFYNDTLSIKDLYVDYTTCFLSCCVWEMIIETCHGLTKSAFLLYLGCIIFWYFLVFLGHICWVLSFTKNFYNLCSDTLLLDERHLSYWCRQPYILLVCFSVATTINLTRRTLFSTILERFTHNIVVSLSNLYYQNKSAFQNISHNEILSQITSFCNPLKKKLVRFLPLPVQYKLVQHDNRQHALTCNLPFVSDIDKFSVMVHLKSQHRQRHLSEHLEAPSFELLQMFWGTRFKFTDFPMKKTLKFWDENTHITAQVSQRLKYHKNSQSTMSSCKSIHSYANVGGSLNSTTFVENSPHNLIHAKDYAHKKKEVHDFDFILHKTNHVRDALNWITLRFHDPQLEIEYQKYRICNGENMEKVFYYIFFLIWTACVINIVWDIRFFFGRGTQDFFAVYYPFSAFLLDCLVFFLSVATYYSIFYSEWFNFIIRLICIICTISKEIVHYIKCEDGTSFASIISVLTFVTLRIPFFYASLQNIAFMIAFAIRYIFTFQKCLGNIQEVNRFFIDHTIFSRDPEVRVFKFNATTSLYSLTHFTPFFFGIQIFIGFVGYKLEYNERCGFFLSYQAHVARQKRREMLNTMLPSFVVEQYLRAALNLTRSLGTVEPKEHGIVSVVFCDVHNFEQLITNVKPTHLIQALDSLFLCFDKCVDFHKGAKVETVFETYLVATSLNPEESSPKKNDTNHAQVAVEIGRSMLEIARCMVYQNKIVSVDPSSQDNLKRKNKTKFKRIHVRIGIHSGSVYSGVVGVKKPQYCLFGDTVNTASRMKSTGMCDRIHISQVTYSFLKNDYKYKWEPRIIQVKGIGLMKTYLLQPVYEKSHYYRSPHQWVSSLSMFEINTSSSFTKDIKKSFQCDDLNLKDILFNKSESSKNSMILKPTIETKSFQKTPLWITSRSSTLTSSSSFLPFNLYTKPLIFQFFINSCHWCLRNFFFPIPTFLHIPSFTISHRKNKSNGEKTKDSHRKKLAPINSIVCPESKYYMFNRLLCFRNAFVEEKFCSQFYKNELNMGSIEQALILFLILFIIETWAIVLLPSENNARHTTDIECLNWATRILFNATLVFLWCLIRKNFSFFIWRKVTRHVLIEVLNFILLTAGTLIILTNIFSSIPLRDRKQVSLSSFTNNPINFLLLNLIFMTPKFSWFPNDMLQFFFYITILHTCSGLLFCQALAFNLTLITILCIIIATHLYNGLNSSKACVLVSFLVVNLISVYLKESTDRTLFVANEELQLTTQRAQELLEDMLPRQILCEYQEDRLKLAYKHENMSFLFADICHFTPWAKRTEAKEVIRLLQQLFNQFDYYTSCFGLFKLCTIGDAYIAVTEPLVTNESCRSAAAHGGKRVLQMAEAMTVSIKSMRSEKQIWDLGMRIGVHYGDCFGGMIGSGRLRYDLWGLDVITANTMESEGKPGHICASDAFCNLINEEFPKQFDFQFYKLVNVCGKQVKTYLLTNTCKNDINKAFECQINENT